MSQQRNEASYFFSLLEKALSAVKSDDQKALLAFARRLFTLAPLDELLQEPIDDVIGFVRSLRAFMSVRPAGDSKIKCFNPNLEDDGWESRHTQLFVLQRDMPFLVDSIRIALTNFSVNIHAVNSTLFGVERDESGRLNTSSEPGQPGSDQEALIYFQIDRLGSADDRLELVNRIRDVLASVERVTGDYKPMTDRLAEVTNAIRLNRTKIGEDALREHIAFLEWLRENHFTFLAYSYYRLSNGEDPTLVLEPEVQLGLFSGLEREHREARLSQLAPGFMAFYEGEALLTLAKSSMRSRIHRDAYCEYVIVKDLDESGKLVGEHRFLGLYTSLVFAQSPFNIPLVRDNLFRVFDRSGLAQDSHYGKVLRQIMETHPREELFHSTQDQLYDILIGIWQIQERSRVKLFLRPDPYEKFISCIIFFPRNVYRTEIREQAQRVLVRQLDASDCQFTTYFTESLLVRTHFLLKIRSDQYRQVDRGLLEQEIQDLTHDWRDDLCASISDHWGDERGLELASTFREAFPASYRDHFQPRSAIHDIELALTLTGDEIAMSSYQPPGEATDIMRLKVFHLHSELLLSNVVPMLENLGFLVIGEHPYRLSPKGRDVIWLHEFTLQFSLRTGLDVPGVRENFQQAFLAVWQQRADNDAFNWLVVGARLDWRSVAVMRAYARYMKQLGTAISADFIAHTLSSNLEITRNLVALFKLHFDPRLTSGEGERGERAERLESKILDALDKVSNLNQDQVLRTYLELIKATVRTNFFQRGEDGEFKPYLAIKLEPRLVSAVPPPRPAYELFVYSPRIEGVHLRSSKVARGGIRWSDRVEDYRTEVLGLVKAQQVKNAVIVPSGAKGGFVAKQLPAESGREAIQQEAVACYQLFMQGLLDVTDNVIKGEVVPPRDMVRRDGDDAYLVVAADKGTATFSDIANEISDRYHHWLGDAFASGGQYGYDHKKMGITARGAWVAVQRHFRELGVDIQKQNFTVLGIGDMAGDVFGNGMLLSPHIQLVAAFNHQSIFIDPDPDPSLSFKERERLFALPRSSWDDYNPECLSPGGAVYSRQAKAITLTPEARDRLGISAETLTPAALIHELLKAPVDLIWNGGIGTYVKGSLESNQAVGDRANDDLRVDGGALRCRVFGEGGNLGMTQQGRIEYALKGGSCNTDFIDNVGGVACSDLEVNIKIFLNRLILDEDLTFKQRNALLVSMTDEVSDLVLENSNRQALAISLAKYRADENISEFWHCLSDWEEAGLIDRKLETLPSDDILLERQKAGYSLTRPELAVLMSYSKILFKGQLQTVNIDDDPYLRDEMLKAFPGSLIQRYGEDIHQHPLRKELVINVIANEIVDRMGLSFPHRQMKSTGADPGQVVRAYMVVRDTLELDRVWAEVEAMQDPEVVQSGFQQNLFLRLMRLGRRASRWIIRNRRNCGNTRSEINVLKPVMTELLAMSGASYQPSEDEADEFISACISKGLSESTALLLDSASDLFFAFGLIDVTLRTGLSLPLVSEAYGLINEKLSFNWFSEQIVQLPTTNRWEDYARESYMDELESLYRAMATALLDDLGDDEEIETRLDHWQLSQKSLFDRWDAMIADLRQSPERDHAMFAVALRELKDLVDTMLSRGNLGEFCALDAPA